MAFDKLALIEVNYLEKFDAKCERTKLVQNVFLKKYAHTVLSRESDSG